MTEYCDYVADDAADEGEAVVATVAAEYWDWFVPEDCMGESEEGYAWVILWVADGEEL